MSNPYAGRPDHTFWRRAVAIEPSSVDPVVAAKFRIEAADRVATAGSCFAQHISRTLVQQGFNYLVTEEGPADRNFGVFPARFGNIYSVRQLLQLFRRAYALFDPVDDAWVRDDGAFADPFRPQIEPAGFPTIAALRADRVEHLAAVRRMFEECDVFVFTLGLTEAWRSTVDGAVFPLAPGVAGAPTHRDFEFFNATVAEMTDDLRRFLAMLRAVNPQVRVLLTVSPVPLIATYEDRHVLVSTIYSKSALRMVAEEVANADPAVAYFPSYEIITGHHAGYRAFEADLRSVSPEGVASVMALFTRHYLHGDKVLVPTRRLPVAAPPPMLERALERAELDALAAVICDEEAIDR